MVTVAVPEMESRPGKERSNRLPTGDVSIIRDRGRGGDEEADREKR